MTKHYPYPVLRNPEFCKKKFKFFYKPDKSVWFYDEEIIVYREIIVEQIKKPGELAKELGLTVGQVVQMRNRVRKFVTLANHYENQRRIKAKKDCQTLKIKVVSLLLFFPKIDYLYQDLFGEYYFVWIKFPLESNKLSTFYNEIVQLANEVIKLKECSVSILPLSNRAKKCLCRSRLKTLEDLLTLEPEDIDLIQGAGVKTKQEILDLLAPITADEYCSN